MRKTLWLVSTAMSCCLSGGSAWAQSANGSLLTDIVVTAQRREEKLQDVPASVTSLDATALAKAGVRTTEDLTIAVPGLVWGRSTAYSQPTIRGVGSRNAGLDESNVATYLDGVYQPDQSTTLLELSNIERIEVLKGPQGTLFGRNATGGAINILTPLPSFVPKGQFSGTYGRFNYRKGAFYLTGPIAGDKLAVGIAASAYGDDGYVKNIYLNETQGKTSGVAVRPKLLFRPTHDLKLQLNGLYSFGRTNTMLSLYSYQGNNVARSAAANPRLNPLGLPVAQLITSDPYTTAGAIVPNTSVIVKLVDAHADYDFGWGSLDIVAAHGASKTKYINLSEVSPLALSDTFFTQHRKYDVTEWTLTSAPGGRLTWIAGLQGYRSKGITPSTTTITRSATTGLLSTSMVLSSENAKSVAGFAEFTWQVVQGLFVAGGLRYTWDHKDSYRQVGTAAPGIGKASWEKLSPRMVTRYEVSDHLNVYASYAQGFKAGIFNTGDSKPVAPENISAFEVGVKGDIGGRVRYALAAYHYDYKDLQVSTLTNVGGVILSAVQNAGKVKINGVEASVSAVITPEFSLDATASILGSKIHDFPNAVVQVPIGGNVGNRTASQNVNGNELIRAPDSSFTVGGTYQHPLGDGTLKLNASAFFSSSYWVEIGNRVKQPGYKVVGASASWRSNKRYYVTVFGQNLTNQVYPVGWLINSSTDGVQAAKPRWFGVTVGYDF
jgi:iron complex outermembrane receptor protein